MSHSPESDIQRRLAGNSVVFLSEVYAGGSKAHLQIEHGERWQKEILTRPLPEINELIERGAITDRSLAEQIRTWDSSALLKDPLGCNLVIAAADEAVSGLQEAERRLFTAMYSLVGSNLQPRGLEELGVRLKLEPPFVTASYELGRYTLTTPLFSQTVRKALLGVI
jgi:hypothetical protein